MRYADAGVNIDNADEMMALMKTAIQRTHGPGVVCPIGHFGAMYQVPDTDLIAVSSVDSVGTRLMTSIWCDRPETSGAALFNHCCNDIAVTGCTQPAYALDYFATGKLDPIVGARMVIGLAEACQGTGCSLIGGETAELPLMYRDGACDLAVTIVGYMRTSELITGNNVSANDVMIALASDGAHTNGYSLLNRLFFITLKMQPDDPLPWGVSVADALLAPHRPYNKALGALHALGLINAAAHITGGGIRDNLRRVLPHGCRAFIRLDSWEIPPLFEFVRREAQQPDDDFWRTFNNGVGMIIVTKKERQDQAMAVLTECGECAWIIGTIREGETGVEFI